MSTIARETATTSVDPSAEEGAPAERRGLGFWVVRYLPAEIAGTAAMIFAGLGVTFWTDSAALIAVAALIGEIIGFYAVLILVIFFEQSRLAGGRRAFARTIVLLIAEFGAAEVLDTLLIRPAALLVGVWVLGDPVWGLLAGKVVADVIFYAIAAGAFTITDKTGLRDRTVLERAA